MNNRTQAAQEITAAVELTRIFYESRSVEVKSSSGILATYETMRRYVENVEDSLWEVGRSQFHKSNFPGKTRRIQRGDYNQK